ncbi:MAG: class I SAM-dependent methyltransferase [Bacteroidota bacterium]
MPHAAATLALRAALRPLVAWGGSLPPDLDAAVRHAAQLRLSPDEAADEAAVDAHRQRLAASDAGVEVIDFGAGTRGGERPPVRRVADVYRRAATTPAWGRLLYGLARAQQPKRVLELGTNLGVGAAHLASALARTEASGGPTGRLVTLEGAPAYATIARQGLERIGHTVGPEGRIEIHVGPFSDTLRDACARGPFDLVFIDGHHEEAAALSYTEQIRPHLVPGALVVLDDVEPGRPVRRAWRRLASGARGALWLGRYGLLALEASR